MTRFTCAGSREIKISFLYGQGQITGTYVAPNGEGDEGVKVLGRDCDRDSLVAKERAAVACQEGGV